MKFRKFKDVYGHEVLVNMDMVTKIMPSMNTKDQVYIFFSPKDVLTIKATMDDVAKELQP